MPEIISIEAQDKQDEIVIDWSLVKKSIRARWKICAAIIVVCALLGLALALVLPKKYESDTLLRAKAKSNSSSMAGGAAAILLGGSMPSQVTNYMELVKSRAVIDPIIAKLDIPEDKKELLTADGFFKAYLKIDNAKGTDLLSITATGKSPQEARMIASGVTDNLQKLLTQLNRDEQSYMVKFLNNRIDTAKKDMDKAANDLEIFKQKDRVFAPDDQAKALIEALSVLDKMKAEAQVTRETSGQTLLQMNSELAQQNAAMEAYKVTDNPAIEQIRSQLIAKELQLIELRQKFTDEQPDVINTKQSITNLQSKLDEELNKSIAAGTTTMNPVQSELIKNKIKAEADAAGASASIAALSKFEQQKMSEVGQLSASGMTYIALARQEKLTQEVYLMLMKQLEQAKIQEALDSLEVQVIDAANLPKRHVFPSKTLFTLVGGVLGGILALVSLLVSYRKMAR